MADQDDGGTVSVNVRSPAQWAVLSSVMDFKNKTVLDIGCGLGDLLLFAVDAGAWIKGVDRNPYIVQECRERGVPVRCADLDNYLWNRYVGQESYDIVFCFSVLPYLPDIDKTLDGLAKIADVAFIEAQLVGDGPGCFEDEDALRKVLEGHWCKVTRIGETKVAIRDTIRAIWMCEGRKEMECCKGGTPCVC